MYHQPSKRRQLIQRIVVYAIMSLAVIALVTALVFVMLGYQFNRGDGKIEQGGLVQFDSRPSGADVTIDGANFGSNTASKTTMTAGQHFITMNRTGYKGWQKSVDVVPGTVLWLNYARLIPKDLKVANVASFAAISSTVSSPDDKWMAIKEDPATPAIRLANVTEDTPKITTLELPAASYTHPAPDKTQRFSLEKWDPDSRYILVKHSYDDTKVEWIIADTQDVAQTKNVTRLLDIDASKIVFDEGNSAIVYAQIGNDVRKVDLGAATLSRPLVTNVAEFSLYDRSTIVYSTVIDPKTNTRSVGYYQDGTELPRTIRSYADDGKPTLHLAIGKYFSDPYVAIAYGENVEILKGALPATEKQAATSLHHQASLTMPGGTQYVSVKTNGRFVIVQNGALYKTYDVELQKTTETTLKGTADVTKELVWLDNYMLWSDRDNMLRLYEFDGTNQHDVMPVASGFSANLSPNSKYLYGIMKENDTAYHLQRVRLLL
ncbi:MAG TPA: PEGA domain-containing protein [Candidatus Saccharimonadales bacterium]|nr:PEGA domain-containing protein [Candidatus Saccharimonadales bacterium]